ncbi:MAG: hypothetical protein CR997_01015 [Acidobacteria bacterium]|nr:MAG: hypothetical protein CR997_01015 [Acidobacteriota bacterium]
MGLVSGYARDEVEPCIRSIATLTITEGDDWSLPSGVTPKEGTGFFSEERSLPHQVSIRSVDVSWRQINPSQGVYNTSLAGSAQGMNFPSLDAQLADPSPFWMRIWASGLDWAPEWVVTDCGVTETWQDYDGQYHIPIWDPCVWNHLMTCYREFFINRNLRSDDRLVMLYVPGAFTWCEFDFEIIEQAASSGLTFTEFNAWFQAAMAEMVAIFNGENATASDDFSYKLVYTGEDYPWGPWNGQADFLARDAVLAGCGIRTGITEVFNFHLNHTPAYGASIAPDGHIVVDENWPLLNDGRVIAAENECFTACGYAVSDVSYAVKMANLKALQLRVNYLYVVPEDSYLDTYAEHWEWVRLSLGRRAEDSPDAWVALREFQDKYWEYDDSHQWQDKPWIHNFERWLVQKDIGTNGQTRRGTDMRVGEVDPDNGTSYEGRRTHHANGQDYIYFYVDDLFLNGFCPSIQLKVTYPDTGHAQWTVEYFNGSGMVQTPVVVNQDTGEVKTASFGIQGIDLNGSLPNQADFRIYNGGAEDLEVRFVRMIKTAHWSRLEDWPDETSILPLVLQVQ